MKRRSVLDRDRRGSYIPVCTRNVFLKYYTDAEGQQIHYWGQHDRDGYLAAMRQHVGPYLLDEDCDLMPGFLTSYAGMFRPAETDAPRVTSIEIPLIQRDYAQGRTDARASDIRERFLDVLHEALTEGRDVGLDFIYGEVEDGTLRPLDGQQRLTTLFLLHWYLALPRGAALRAAGMDEFLLRDPTERAPVLRAARTRNPPPDESAPAAWIIDQPWYLYVWRNDPTIQAMLVMIDAIHRRFADCDPDSAWERLIDSDAPAISFQLLPIDDMGSGEDLYIKMNSRGKPLTPLRELQGPLRTRHRVGRRHGTEFDHQIDGSWSDILWRLRGYDDIVDDKFMRYFEFITDICQWRAGQLPGGVRLETRALQLFGTAGRQAEESLEFLFHAFDTWAGADIGDEFGQLFATNRADLARNPDRLLLFGTETGADLFDACCRHYGTQRFTYGRTLLLFAVLLDRASPSEEFPRRLRVLRNLIEASESELRPHRLPALVADVQRIVVDGSLDEINGFNRAQADDEQAKWAFLRAHPDLATVLFRLEDHPLLRGSLQAFDLDAATFAHRAAAFESLMAAPDGWRDLTGALLAAGNYARRRNDRDLQFGSPSNGEPWRNLLTGTSRANLRRTADALGKVLDAVAAGTAPRVSLRQMQDAFVRSREATGEFDWRYYLVRYDTMREGASGIYASVGGNMGYLVCMLDKTQMNGRYRDPYLAALARQQAQTPGCPRAARRYSPADTSSTSDGWSFRVAAPRCAAPRDGWVLRRPEREEFLERFDNVCAEFGVDEQLKLAVPQQVRDGGYVDAQRPRPSRSPLAQSTRSRGPLARRRAAGRARPG